LDVSKESDIIRIIDNGAQHYGKLDVWINNAGITAFRDLLEVTAEEIGQGLRHQRPGRILGAKHAFKHLKEKGGVIINAASFTSLMPSANAGTYSSSKAAVLSLTKTLAAEFAPYNIRVSCYIPGYIATEMTTKGVYANTEAMVQPIALHRPGKPTDLVGPVLFMASDYAAYMTGNYMEVSGGKFCVQNASYAWNKKKKVIVQVNKKNPAGGPDFFYLPAAAPSSFLPPAGSGEIEPDKG
jgi:NAD(P)-dependent dehydrogenase (short-subunit alcohol dehydrogenase family)